MSTAGSGDSLDKGVLLGGGRAVPGQVPGVGPPASMRAVMDPELGRALSSMPKPTTAASLLDRPVRSPREVVDGLGLSPVARKRLERLVEETLRTSQNRVQVARSIAVALRPEGADPVLREVVQRRAVRLFLKLQAEKPRPPLSRPAHIGASRKLRRMTKAEIAAGPQPHWKPIYLPRRLRPEHRYREFEISKITFKALSLGYVPRIEGQLLKAKTHKYIRREPKPGGGYRYWYNTSDWILSPDLKAGDSLVLHDKGKRGHFHVTKILGKPDQRLIELKHDATGKYSLVSQARFVRLLQNQHPDAAGAASKPAPEPQRAKAEEAPHPNVAHELERARKAADKADRERIAAEQAAWAANKDGAEDRLKRRQLPPVEDIDHQTRQEAWERSANELQESFTEDSLLKAYRAGVAYIEADKDRAHPQSPGVDLDAAQARLEAAFPGGLEPGAVAEQLAVYPGFYKDWRDLREAGRSIKASAVRAAERKTRQVVLDFAYQAIEPTPELLRMGNRLGPAAAPTQDLATRVRQVAAHEGEDEAVGDWDVQTDDALYSVRLEGERIHLRLADVERRHITPGVVERLTEEHEEGLRQLRAGQVAAFRRLTGFDLERDPTDVEMAKGMQRLVEDMRREVSQKLDTAEHDQLAKEALDNLVETKTPDFKGDEYEVLRSLLEQDMGLKIPRFSKINKPGGKAEIMRKVSGAVGDAVQRIYDQGQDPTGDHAFNLRDIRGTIFGLYGEPDLGERAVAYEVVRRRVTGQDEASSVDSVKAALVGSEALPGQPWGASQPLGFVARLLHEGSVAKAELHYGVTDRAYCDQRNNIGLEEPVDLLAVVHEYGHALEHDHTSAGRASKAMVGDRSSDECVHFLSQTRSDRHEPHEIAYEDAWHDGYIGRHYDGEPSTEVLSMGLEALSRDPIGFVQADWRHALHVFALVTGAHGHAESVYKHASRSDMVGRGKSPGKRHLHGADREAASQGVP